MGNLYRSKHELCFIYKSGTTPHINNIEPVAMLRDAILDVTRRGGIKCLIGCSALIENGALQFPQKEPDWWAEFKKELLSFPGSRYKDQVDALTQCINYAMQQ